MMMTAIENWALHAYADGELEGQERDEVERRLADDPEARRLLEAIRREKEALHSAYDGVLDEPVPPGLLAATQPGPARRAPWAAMAAAVALLALGASGGWLAGQWNGASPMESLAQKARVAYGVYSVEVRHPVEVPGDQKDHLQAWLSKRIGEPIRIPDLSAQGYTLLGGRLLTADDKPAGQLMYEDANKQRLAIFLTRNAKKQEASMRVDEAVGVISCYWLDEHLGMAITGEMPRERMLALADEIYRQVDQGEKG